MAKAIKRAPVRKQVAQPPAVISEPTPNILLHTAIEKGADIEQLKQLMDLQERWEKKEARKKFFEALSLFQSIVPILKKTKTANITSQRGGSFQYKYADLGSITSQIKEALNKCGLTYRWEFQENNGLLKCTCLLSHKEGHTEMSSIEAGKDASGSKNDIQQKGSTQTYLQRYTLIGALGLSTADDDDDGNKNSTRRATGQEDESEILYQWQQAVDNTINRVDLQQLYLKNKRTIDSDKKIQAIFKNKEAEYKLKQGKSKQGELLK